MRWIVIGVSTFESAGVGHGVMRPGSESRITDSPKGSRTPGNLCASGWKALQHDWGFTVVSRRERQMGASDLFDETNDLGGIREDFRSPAVAWRMKWIAGFMRSQSVYLIYLRVVVNAQFDTARVVRQA